MAEQYLSLSPQLHSDPLTAFAEALFGHLPRADQRRWAHGYLRGLLTTPGKKSVRRLAATISTSSTASQSLQQFVNASPWDWEPAREKLTRVAERHLTPLAWTVTSAVLPKRGAHSCGVHRRFVPQAGRIINCQVGVGVFLSSAGTHLPVDWRLILPERWSHDERLRDRARIPGTARHRPFWVHALDLLDALASRTTRAPLPAVVDMSKHMEAARLIGGLSRRGQDFVVAVPLGLPVLPLGSCPAPPVNSPADPGTAQGCVSVQRFLQRLGARPTHTAAVTLEQEVTLEQGDARILSARVRLPGGSHTCHTYRLFAEWCPTRRRPTGAWVSSLLEERVDRLMGLARLDSGTAATVSRLEADYGLLDFEGRSYPGWHHHMTLVSAAYAYARLATTLAPDSEPLPWAA
ncbi:IS701 family transposase [Streptomyces phyllanthi]|uniref:Transposase n=1 Tax=Streptomyces phyllanthi TaxID=1803180 RepID=A0A5N8W699_9ACTN|nr:transposase [Streptomyces phyllanthi]MPY43001.1 transposase [Streptomyces phyllanthi]